MKIAYVILAHTDPGHIQRLAKKLAEDPQNAVFIHVDLKTDITPFEEALHGCPSVFFVQKRVKVYWGGFSSVSATINAFREALSHGDFDRFVILQGLDYPIRSNAEISGFFQAHPDTEFINAINASRSEQFGVKHKYRYVWTWDKTPMSRLFLVVFKVLYKLKMPLWFKPCRVREAGETFEIYEGWAHIALTRRCVEFVVRFHDSHPKFNRFFRTVYASDESYFHTIVYNSEFARNATSDGRGVIRGHASALLNLTYFEYRGLVRIFTEPSEFEIFRDSRYLFFRKANSSSG